MDAACRCSHVGGTLEVQHASPHGSDTCTSCCQGFCKIRKRLCHRGALTMGDVLLSSVAAGRNLLLPMRVSNPGPVLDQNCSPALGPENLSGM